MKLVEIIRTHTRLLALGVFLAVFATVGFMAAMPAAADDAAQMSLSASGAIDCDGTTCQAEPGDTFSVAVNADVIPEGGYVAVTSVVQYGPGLTYTPTDDDFDEVLWPDCDDAVSLRAEFPDDSIHHGCLTGLVPPLPLSTYTGPVFEIELTCSDTFTSNDVLLLPFGDQLAGTSGAAFATDPETQVTPKVESLTIACGDPPTPTPEPDDDDGEEPVDGLPGTGTGPQVGQGNGTNPMLWAMISALLAIGVAAAGVFVRRTATNKSQ